MGGYIEGAERDAVGDVIRDSLRLNLLQLWSSCGLRNPQGAS